MPNGLLKLKDKNRKDSVYYVEDVISGHQSKNYSSDHMKGEFIRGWVCPRRSYWTVNKFFSPTLSNQNKGVRSVTLSYGLKNKIFKMKLLHHYNFGLYL